MSNLVDQFKNSSRILKSSKSNQKNSSRLQILSSLIILNIMFDHWDPSTRYEKTVAPPLQKLRLHAKNYKHNENSDACRLRPAIFTTNDGFKTRKLPTKKKPYLSGILIKNKEEGIVTFRLLILLIYTMMYAVVFEMLHHLQQYKFN